jgi:glycosyltransferase involved in cell wall biosynthesis
MAGKVSIFSYIEYQSLSVSVRFMHILMVIPYFEWSFGGPVLVTVGLARELARRGHEVTVITTDMGFSRRLAEGVPITIPGVKILWYPILSYTLARKLQFQYSPALARAIMEEVARADVVHLQEARSVPNAQAWMAARRQGVPLILQSHGAAYYAIPGANGLSGAMKRLYDLLVGARIWRESWSIYALNADEAGFYRERGIDSVRIVPNGIDPPASLPPAGEFRRSRDIPHDAPLVLYLGRINETKGLSFLVEAFARLEDQRSRLVVIGPDDGYLEVLRTMARSHGVEDRLLYTGFIESEEKVAAFVDADVFATPRFFGFPMTFLESASCGTPILTTDGGDRLDWIDGEAGIVTPYDVDAYAEAMAACCTDRVLRDRLGSRAKAIFYERFTWGRIAETIEADYREAATRCGRLG